MSWKHATVLPACRNSADFMLSSSVMANHRLAFHSGCYLQLANALARNAHLDRLLNRSNISLKVLLCCWHTSWVIISFILMTLLTDEALILQREI